MFSAVYVTAVLLALLAQTSPLLFTVGPGLRVDLTLMVVVYFSLFWGWRASAGVRVSHWARSRRAFQ